MSHSRQGTEHLRRTAPLGRTGLEVTPLTLGTSNLGRGEDSPDKRDTLARVLGAAEVGVVDTSNEYGDSERRVGAALAAAGPAAAGTLVATKVDPVPGSGDYSGDRVRASVRESQERLGLDHLPLVHLHDPERLDFDDALAAEGPVRTLLDLQDAGVVGAVGVAGGPAAMMERYVRTGLFSAAVTHNRWTLLDRSAEGLLDACAELDVGLFNAAPFGGGFLAGRPARDGRYAYRPVVPAVLQAAEAMAERCDRHGVPLAAAALQWSLREPRVRSTIVGASSPAHLEAVLTQASLPVPEELWAELEALVPAREHWLGPDGR